MLLSSPLEKNFFFSLEKYQIVRTTLNDSETDGQDVEASGAFSFL